MRPTRARHASPLFVLLAEEEDDKGAEVGWAGQMGWPAGPRQMSPGEVLYFISILFYFVKFVLPLFGFKIIQTMPKTPLNILYC